MSSNQSGKCWYERATRGTVCSTMRSMCGAGAGCLAIDHQSLWRARWCRTKVSYSKRSRRHLSMPRWARSPGGSIRLPTTTPKPCAFAAHTPRAPYDTASVASAPSRVYGREHLECILLPPTTPKPCAFAARRSFRLSDSYGRLDRAIPRRAYLHGGRPLDPSGSSSSQQRRTPEIVL